MYQPCMIGKFHLFINCLNNFSQLKSMEGFEISSFLMKSEEILLFISTRLQHVLVFNQVVELLKACKEYL